MTQTALIVQAAHLLEQGVTNATRLSGGDLSGVFRLRLADGQRLIAKTGPSPRVEATMLREIAASGAPTPEVVAVNDDLLILQDLGPEDSLSAMGWRELGQALRLLHIETTPRFGYRHDYAFGSVPICNEETQDWGPFWATRRLIEPSAPLPTDLRARIHALAETLPQRLHSPKPALLHGDLWIGNVFAQNGRFRAFIDPASYFGDAEVDIAMLHLFASPPAALWEGYGALPDGWQDRQPIYQLWPAIVHARLFGPSYHPMVSDFLHKLGH